MKELLPLWVFSSPNSSGRRRVCPRFLRELWTDCSYRNSSPFPFGWEEAFWCKYQSFPTSAWSGSFVVIPPSGETAALKPWEWGRICNQLCGFVTKMNKVNKVLRIIKKSSRRRRWREELRLEEEVESQELCDPSGLCRLHLCVGGKKNPPDFYDWPEICVWFKSISDVLEDLPKASLACFSRAYVLEAVAFRTKHGEVRPALLPFLPLTLCTILCRSF